MNPDRGSEWLDGPVLEGALARAYGRDPSGGAGPGALLPGGGGARYEVHEELARGGMGIVLRGHDAELGRDIAIKVLRAEHAGDPAMRARFLREARIGGRLQHPGIVPVYDVGQRSDQGPYLTMKLIGGRTLAARIADPDAARDRLLAAFEQVCQAVGYAHRCGVVHRDLKPHNVMVGEFGEVVVVDWGLASTTDGAFAPAVAAAADAPARGDVVGTPGYMAPEQARGEPADARSDVFALGAMLCELLTGAPPFAGKDSRVLRERTARADLAECQERLRLCAGDEELVALCRACLAADPAGRPSDGAAVAEALARHRAALHARLRATELARAEAASRAAAERRARRVTLAAAVGVTTVVLAAAFLWSSWQRERLAARTVVVDAVARARVTVDAGRTAAAGATAAWDQALAAATDAVAIAAQSGVDPKLVEDARRLQDEATAGREHAGRVATLTADLQAALAPGIYQLNGTATSPICNAAVFDRAYAKAFARYAGGDLLAMEPELAARLLADSRVADLAYFFDHWAVQLRALAAVPGSHAGDRIPGLLVLARALGPAAAATVRVRAEIERGMPSVATLEPLAAGALPAVAALLVGDALWGARAFGAARGCWRRAALRSPADIALVVRLARAADLVGTQDEAITWFRVATALRPDDPPTQHELGTALIHCKRFDDAEAVFTAMLDRDPEDVRACCGLGDLMLSKARPEQALAWFERASASRPDLCPPRRGVAAALRSLGRTDEAISVLRATLAKWPDDGEVHRFLATMYRTAGSYDEAVAEYRAAIATDPWSLDARRFLAVTLRSASRTDEATQALRDAIAFVPDYAPFHEELARTLRRDLAHDEALQAARKAVDLDPGQASAWLLVGQLERRAEDLPRAVDAFERAIKLDPESVQALKELADILFVHQQYDEAVERLRRIIELRPEAAAPELVLATLLGRLDRPAEGIPHAERAVTLEPDRASFRQALAELLHDVGRSEDSFAAYEQALALSAAAAPGRRLPTILWVRSHLRLAAMCRDRGDEAGSRSHVDAVRQSFAATTDPASRLDVIIDLARYLSDDDDDLDEAVRMLEGALADSSDRFHLIRLHVALATTLERAGRTAEAIAHLRAGIEMAGSGPSSTMHYNLANLLRDAGDPDGAIAEYDLAIRDRAAVPEAHMNRAIVLRALGRKVEALEGYRAAHQLWSRQSTAYAQLWRDNAAAAIRELEQELHR